ncbi:hypothetical protein GMD24_10545 [Phascolarctobacterium faecium]|uniref:Phage MuF C-terminal domain-containing protein n=2 Tax=Bacillota TaxID=1239 RepID=A0A7X2XH87_9FIRM|nr:hypothetical protein [Phascolarctobacterium faecium]KAA3380305.1 hypothetical protein F1907_12260 [Akkermansia muciniphila]MTS81977.1 hypothetical protein [Phascolarctobacterium faecium]MTT03359.1 hypothetical protein [Phascolarctobacterium faecium]MTT17288.1 hypothetical protein [Phascolarctobacterium faecium]MTT35384.1 hypothetical protein [Phascolarctobacterium faecium]
MARSLLYDVAAAGKFIPEDLKTKALQGANANNISLQMAARNPDYYLPKNFEYDWNKYEQIAPRTAEALKDPVLMSIAGTKAAEFWGEQENNWKSITALKNGFKNVARSGYGTVALLADLGADKKDADLTMESKVFSADTIGRLLYAVGGDKLKTIGTEAKRIGGSEIFKPEEVKAETAAGQFYYDLLQNAPQLAAQVGVAISTGGWSAAAFMGSQIAGGQYLDLTEAGVSNDRARAAASLNAVAQSALEKVGLGKVMGAGARAAKIATMGGKAKEVFKTALTEGITEWIQEYPDAAAEIWAKNANLSTQEQILKFYQEFGEITKRGAYSGAIGAVFGGLGGSVSIAVDRNANRVMQEQAVRTAETMKNSKDVDITASKLVLNQTTEEKAYVDAETLFTYAQANPNLDVKDTFGIEVSELQAAAVRGEDIEMPMGTYCAAEAQNPGFFQAVSNNVAFEQGGYTEERARNKKALQSAYKKALENDEEFRTAVDTFRNELTEAGLNQKETGDVLAILTSRAMIANPDDPMQYFRDNPLSFKRVVSTPNGRYMQTKSANEKLLEDENNFSGIVDEYTAGKINDTKTYNVMTTPLALGLAGGKILPVTIDGSKIKHIFDGHSDGMTPELLKQVPRAMADPMMVLDSYAGRKVVVLDLKDAQGSTIIVPLELDVERNRYQVNAVSSAYGKGGENGTDYDWFIEHNLKKGRVSYINKEKTAKWLQSPGSDSASRGNDLDSLLNNSIPDENALRKRREEMQGYYQAEGKTKGAITWDEEGKAIISLFEGADMSTVIHEAVGHYFIENLMREGALPNATEQMKKDRQTMLDYAGVTKDWDSLSQEEKTAAHERWAEAAETYMLEGKAPSKELQPVFNRFKKWLLAVYNAVFSDKRSKNAVPINDEVRQVFDRMLASEEQISEMERIDGYFSALPDVVLDALSEPRKQMLRNFAAKAHDKAVQLLTKESLVNFNQERKDRIQKYREDVEPQVKEAIAKQPLYMASEQILDIASDLKTAKGVANRYLEGNFDESKMATFDMIAEANGFTSGDELAKTIISEPSFNGAVNRHIDEMVQDAFPDIYKERGLAEEAARDAMYNDESGLLINTEAQLIEDKVQGLLKGQRDAETLRKLAVARRQTAKIQAQMDLQNRVKLKEALNTQKYITAERNAAAKAAVALENDDYSAAVRYKNVQAFNHACVVESVRLRNQYAKWQNYFRKQAKAKRETWGNERNFIQAAAIMERFGYKRKDYSDFEKTETLSDYLNDMDDLYDNVAVADWIMDEDVSITNPRERMTASQLEDVVNALKNIKAIAKQEMSINALQKGVTYAEFKAEAQETLNKLKTIWKPQVGVTQQPTVMEKLKASLRSTDNLFEMMDDWQYGFFSKHFGAAIREAADNETRKILEYEEKTAQVYREWLPDKAAEKAADYQEKYDELGTSVDKHVLVKMLMNLGNESSARVLCSTRPVGFESAALWVDGDIVQTKINLLDFLGRNLTEADIKYAQAKIDIAEMYWSEMEALETRWTGFSPKKVEASPVELTLSDGKTVVMRGGYFPLMRDGDTGSKHAGQEVISDTDPRQGRNIRTMSTRRGHLKERVKAKYPVNLKRGAEFNVAMDAIHDLCFREVMGDFRKIMNDQEMYTLIKEKLGLADFSAFKEYLERAANPQGTNSGSVGESWMGSVANWLRARTVNAAIMLNLKTAVQNLGNPLLYGNAVDGFGYSDVVAAVSNYSMNMQLAEGYKSAKEFVYSKSPWMKERSVLPDISLRDMKEMESLNPIEKKAVEFGTRLLVATDNISAIPVWMQAYGKKIRAGAGETEAVDFANTVIRRTLGSSRVTEVAPLLRGGPMLKLFTTFQGFFNTQYNQWAREYNIFLKEKDIMRLTSFVGAKFVMFAFINLMLSAEDPFEEDKDEYQKISKELLTYPMSLAGPVGQVGNAIWSRALGMQTYGYRMTVVQGTIEQMERAAGKVQKVYQGKADYDELVEPTATFVGTALGVPAQLNKLFFNGYDILFNGMDPEVGDIFRRRPKKER